MRRAAAASALLAALGLLWLGGSLVNAPLRMGGPMNMDLSGPLGALAVLGGMAALALLPSGWQRAGWGLAGAVVVGTVGWNLWQFPPFADGAYFTLRYDLRDLDRAPAAAAQTVVGLAPLTCAVAGAAVPWPWNRALLPGLAVPAAVVACPAYGWFADGFAGVDGPWPRGLLVLVPCGVLAVLGLRRAWHAGLRVAGAQALVLLVLCLVTWAAWEMVV